MAMTLNFGLRRTRFTVYFVLIILAAQNTHSAPIENNLTHIVEYDGAGGCYYNFQHYQEGARIETNEPCLNCTCHNRMLMCYLRVCPFSKAIGQDCTVEKRPDQCCPVITCPEVPVQLLTSTTSSPAATKSSSALSSESTELGFPDTYGCSVHEQFFADGAQLPINASNPCELCYCIRNKTTCLMQQCTLSVAGCKPVYQPGICCPVKYNCDYDENDETTPGLIMTTTTLAPRTTPPQCTHDDKIYDDGELIYTIQPCQHCYCFHGDIVCAVQECGKPMESHDKNCTALPPLDGECCPSYRCEDGTANFATELPEVTDRNEVPQVSAKESFPGANNNIPDEIAGDHSFKIEEPTTASAIENEVPELSTSVSPSIPDERKPIESLEPHDDQTTDKVLISDRTSDETVVQSTTPVPTESEKETVSMSEFPHQKQGNENRDGAAVTESNNVAEVSTESKLPQVDTNKNSDMDKGVEITSNEPEVFTELELTGSTITPEEVGNVTSTPVDAMTVSELVDNKYSNPVSDVITTELNIEASGSTTTTSFPTIAHEPENMETVTARDTPVVTTEPVKDDETVKGLDSGTSTTLTSDIEKEYDTSKEVGSQATTDEIVTEVDNSEKITSVPEATTTKLNDGIRFEETNETISSDISSPENIQNIIPEEPDTTTLVNDISKPVESVTSEPENIISEHTSEDNEGAETGVPFETSTFPNIESKIPEAEEETPSTIKPTEHKQPQTEESPQENIITQDPQEPILEVSEEPSIPEMGPSGIPSVSKPERGPVNKKVDSNETLSEPEVTEEPLITGSGMPHNVDNLHTEESEYGSTTYLPPVGSSTEADRQSSTPVYEEPPKDDLDVEKQTTEQLSITPKITYDTTTVRQTEDTSFEMPEEEKSSVENDSNSKTSDEEASTIKYIDSSSSTEEVPSETSDESIAQKEAEAEETSKVNILDEEMTTVSGVKENNSSINDEGQNSTEAPEEETDASKSPQVEEVVTSAPEVDQSSEKTVSEDNSSEPVTIAEVSSEKPELVSGSQDGSTEVNISSPSTESTQNSEVSESVTEIPIVVEPEVTGSIGTEKTPETPVEPIDSDTNTTVLPEEDETITQKSENPTETSSETTTSKPSVAPISTSTENLKESSTEPDELSKLVPELTSTTTASHDTASEQESVSEPTTEKSTTPEDTSEKIEESSQSTKSNEITSQNPVVEEEVTRSSSGIPGEGNCLVDGQSYTNNSAVPPSNACQLSCQCISSMVNCELVKCLPPPDDLPPNCTPVYSADSCCPMYVCESTPKVELEAGNQMSDSRTTPAYDENKIKTTEKLTEEFSTEQPKVEESTDSAINTQPDKESTTPVPLVEEEAVSISVSTESSAVSPTIDVRNNEDETTEPSLPIEPTKGTEEMSTAVVDSIETTSQKVSTEEEILPIVTDTSPPQKSDSELESQTDKGDSESNTEQYEAEGSSEPNNAVEIGQDDGNSNIQSPETSESSEPTKTVEIGQDDGNSNIQSPVTSESSEPTKTVEIGQDDNSNTQSSATSETSEQTKPLEISHDNDNSSTQSSEINEPSVTEPIVSTIIPIAFDTKDIISGSSEKSTSPGVAEVTSSSALDSTTFSSKKSAEEEMQQPEDLQSENETPEPMLSIPVTRSDLSVQEITDDVQESTSLSSAIPERESTEDSSTKSSQDMLESSPLPETDVSTISPEHSSIPISVATEEVDKQQESTTESSTSETSDNVPKEMFDNEPSTSMPVIEDNSTPVSTETKTSEEPPQTTVHPEVETPEGPSSTMLPVDEATKEPEILAETSSMEPHREETTEPNKSINSESTEKTIIESTEAPKEYSKEESITTVAPLDQPDVKVVSSESPVENETETESSVDGNGETNVETKVEISTQLSEVLEDNKDEATTLVPKSEEPSATTAIEEQPSTDDQAQEHPIEIPAETPIETVTEIEEIISSEAPEPHEETTKDEPEVSSKEPLSTVEPVKPVDEKEASSVEQNSTEKPSLETTSSASSTSESTISEITSSESSIDERLSENDSSTLSVTPEEPVSSSESSSDISISSTPEIQKQSTEESTSVQEVAVSTEPSSEVSSSDDQQIHDTQVQHTEEPIAQDPQNVPEQSTEHLETMVAHKRPEYPDQPENLPETDDETIFPPEGGNVKDQETSDSDGEDYDGTDEHIYGPGTCRYGGKIYMSAQQIPRDDPCDFCFCFRSDIICLQQSCPPPIPGCHEEPINGFCCPRYECPVSMATSLNITTTTTTTTTTVPPHFLSHAYRGNASRGGCQIGNRAYQIGEEIKSKSGPCMGCTCGGDGKMKCEPKACSASPMLKEMIAHAAAKRRRR